MSAIGLGCVKTSVPEEGAESFSLLSSSDSARRYFFFLKLTMSRGKFLSVNLTSEFSHSLGARWYRDRDARLPMPNTYELWQYAREALLSALAAKSDDDRKSLLELARTLDTSGAARAPPTSRMSPPQLRHFGPSIVRTFPSLAAYRRAASNLVPRISPEGFLRPTTGRHNQHKRIPRRSQAFSLDKFPSGHLGTFPEQRM